MYRFGVSITNAVSGRLKTMSLSFVSSAVLSSTDGVSHNEEKPIESTETKALRSSASYGGGRGLFDQLRSNRESEEEKRDEAAKALRGTRTLDEEDCAHLESVERVRIDREAQMRDEVEEEVAAFRAARADRNAAGADEADGEFSKDEETTRCDFPAPLEVPQRKAVESLASISPKIVIKKRRPRDVRGKTDGSDENRRPGEAALKRPKKDAGATKASLPVYPNEPKIFFENSELESNGLGGLLGCYGSDSESE